MASDLDKSTQQQLNRGQRMQEILKQPQYQPMDVENQVIVIFAGTNGFADGVPLEKMAQWQADLIRFMATSYPEIGKDILAKKTITDETRLALTKALESFRAGWQA
jgi:F-type H+-transporting ATPase subunit alpha